jgi:hypothetical protein
MLQALVRGDGISEYERRASERYFSERPTRGTGDRFSSSSEGCVRSTIVTKETSHDKGLMEAEGSETKEAMGSNGDDVESSRTWMRTEIDVGDRGRRSGDGGRRSEVGMTWS